MERWALSGLQSWQVGFTCKNPGDARPAHVLTNAAVPATGASRLIQTNNTQ